MNKIYIGIDPGLSGAIAKIEGNNVEIIPMPVYETENAKKLNLRVLESWFQELDRTTTNIVIEYAAVGGFDFQGRTQGVASTYKIGFNYGLILGLLTGLGFSFDIVASHKWQRHMFPRIKKSGTKTTSIGTAKELYPQVNLIPNRGRVDNHNWADALLIAEYCRRINSKTHTWEALYGR